MFSPCKVRLCVEQLEDRNAASGITIGPPPPVPVSLGEHSPVTVTVGGESLTSLDLTKTLPNGTVQTPPAASDIGLFAATQIPIAPFIGSSVTNLGGGNSPVTVQLVGGQTVLTNPNAPVSPEIIEYPIVSALIQVVLQSLRD